MVWIVEKIRLHRKFFGHHIYLLSVNSDLYLNNSIHPKGVFDHNCWEIISIEKLLVLSCGELAVSDSDLMLCGYDTRLCCNV